MAPRKPKPPPDPLDALRAEVAALRADLVAHNTRLSPEAIGTIATLSERYRAVVYLRAAGFHEAADALDHGLHEHNLGRKDLNLD